MEKRDANLQNAPDVRTDGAANRLNTVGTTIGSTELRGKLRQAIFDFQRTLQQWRLDAGVASEQRLEAAFQNLSGFSVKVPHVSVSGAPLKMQMNFGDLLQGVEKALKAERTTRGPVMMESATH